MNPLKTIALAALLGAGCALHAASVNDAYASRSTLVTGLPSIANNEGGSLEPSEPVPAGVNAANYQATLWWQFTPTINGWYEFNTAGSACPTILSLWSGGGASFSTPPSLLKVNSNSANGKVSVWFYASNTISYQIAVAANGAGRGNVTLNAFFIPDPFAQVNAISLSSGTADVSTGAVPGSATLSISATREITSGTFTLADPNGQTIVSVPLSAAQRTAGDVASGTYVVNFTLPRYIQPGAYAWSAVFNNTALNRQSTQGAGAQLAAPGGNSGTILVQNNGGVDTYGLWLAQNNPAVLASVTAADGTLNLGALLGNSTPTPQSLTQFAFGMNPGQAGGQTMSWNSGNLSLGLPQIGTATDADGHTQRLRVQYVTRMNDTSLAYTVQFSSDLVNWTDSKATPSPVTNDGTYQVLEVQDSATSNDSTHRFARVKVGYALGN